MKITQITVKAGRTFNHPFESYSNLRPEVELTATVDDGESPIEAAAELQETAEKLVEDHKTKMLDRIYSLQRTQTVTNNLARIYLEGMSRAGYVASLAINGEVSARHSYSAPASTEGGA